jgi:TrmH family RNA methyltransferase
MSFSPAPILVLVAPQDIVNIGSAVRIAKNFGLSQLRLVAPEIFDPWRIEGIAHNTADLIERITIHPTLAEAVADCVWTVALTARERTAKRTVFRPGAAAAELAARAQDGPVACVAGREDKGLSNEELDLCHALVTIPTNPDYKSLNLAQAVAIMCYEIMLARGGEGRPIKPPRKPADPASKELLERLFADWQRALWGIDFFKTRQADHVMRSLREVLYRAELDGREASLLRAMGIEVVRFLERQGVPLPAQATRVGRGQGAGDRRPEG